MVYDNKQSNNDIGINQNYIHRGMRMLKSLLVIFMCCFSAQALADAEFKIISLQHRFAEDILSSIQPLVGSEGSVTALQNNLIIRASSENMLQIEQVIATLDTVRQNLKITVKRENNLNTQDNQIGVSGRKRIGNVAISNNRYPNTRQDGVQVDITNKQSDAYNSSNQFINVVDGERAFISTGQSIPYTQEWVLLTKRYIQMQRVTEFVEINTGFAVRPRSIGNQIELEITPRFSQPNQSGVIDFETLTTIVRVNKGDWLDLGGIMQQKDDVSRAILSRSNNGQSTSSHLLIRVE